MFGKRVNTSNALGRLAAAVAVAVGVMGLLSACATGPVPVESTKAAEETVRKLAAQRWKSLIAGDFATAYTFATPSYRQIYSPEAFRGSKQGVVKWVGAEILRVDCAETKCSVQVELESKFMTPIQIKGTVKSGVDETWVREGGQWWMFEKL